MPKGFGKSLVPMHFLYQSSSSKTWIPTLDGLNLTVPNVSLTEQPPLAHGVASFPAPVAERRVGHILTAVITGVVMVQFPQSKPWEKFFTFG
jgi:hypothetical protein